MRRQCGDCQLCCKLLPVPPLDKKAGQRCKHQKFGKGCTVYHTAKMPPECAIWNCRWLVNDDTADLPRPDRSHYVIDIMPDFVTLQPNNGDPPQHIQVVQIWIDPKHPEARHDPALQRYLIRRAEQGIAALIRLNARDAITLFAPPFNAEGQWHEINSARAGRQHSLPEIVQALGSVD
jgi:hypothetical protein